MRVKLTPEWASHEEVLRRDLDYVQRIAEKYNKELKVEDPLAERVKARRDETKTADLDEVKRGLDLYLAYLRRVFYYCHYCCKDCSSSAEEFLRTCGEHHLRRPLSERFMSSTMLDHKMENYRSRFARHVDAVLRGLDQRALARLKYKDPEESLESFMKRKIQYVNVSKYKCLMPGCTKQFKGEDFIRKHLRNKHTKEVDAHEHFARTFSAYLRDALKLTFADILGRRQANYGPPQFAMTVSSKLFSLGSGLMNAPGFTGYQQPKRRRESHDYGVVPEAAKTSERVMLEGHSRTGKRARVGYQDLDALDRKVDESVEISYD
jgi:hypothetical protein